MPVKITAKEKKLIKAQVISDFNDHLTELQYEWWDDDRTMSTLQESILYAVQQALGESVERVMSDFLDKQNVELETKDNEELKRLRAENKKLRQDLKEYAAIDKVIKEARK